MKKLDIKNYQKEKGQFVNANGAEFTVKPVIAQEDVSTLHANFVEVEPGHFAYGYHWHERNEEVFYIISGTAAVQTKDKEITLHAGDAITFPIKCWWCAKTALLFTTNPLNKTLKPRPTKRGFILLANRVEIGHNNKDKHGDKK